MKPPELSSLTSSLAAALLSLLVASAGCAEDTPGGAAEAPASPQDPAGDPVEDPGSEDPDPEAPEIDLGLSIQSVAPARGLIAGGEEVMVSGSGFEEGMVVLFGESLALDVFTLSDDTLLMRTPARPAGTVDVTLYHPGIEFGSPRVLESAFTFYDELQITSVEPRHGSVAGGNPITIEGSGFDGAVEAFVGGARVLHLARMDSTRLVGVAPPGAVGAADVHVTAATGVAVNKDAYRYHEAIALTHLSPVAGAASGGESVRLFGAGFAPGVEVRFGGEQAHIAAVSEDGRTLEVSSPSGLPGAVGDVEVAAPWGTAVLPAAWWWMDGPPQPGNVACYAMAPSSGSTLGGESVSLACKGVVGPTGLEVSFGGSPATVLAVDSQHATIEVISPAGAAGAADVTVRYGGIDAHLPSPFVYEAPSELRVVSVTPGFGPAEGGGDLTIKGNGFDESTLLRVGALAAIDIKRVDGTTLTATAPIGNPGPVDVSVESASGEVAVLDSGYVYTSDALALHLMSPTFAARAGGTLLRVYGTGFKPGMSLTIGGSPAQIETIVSQTELIAYSPTLEPGTHDAFLRRPGSPGSAEQTDELIGALTVYDPAAGQGGTWGDPIEDTVNVTVVDIYYGQPIASAVVIVDDPNGIHLSGTTDDRGQVSLAALGMVGPVAVAATKLAHDAYSVVHFDATNVTVFLRPQVPPPPPGGGGGGPSVLPNAVLKGKVMGLGKFVPAPGGSCNGLAIAETEHCAPCEAEKGCKGEDFLCVDSGIEGGRCLQSCMLQSDCPSGYNCVGSVDGTRCVPSPGDKVAKCYVTQTNQFATEGTVYPVSWVYPNQGQTEYTLSSRLGDVAVVCFGGYRTADGVFTPTVMGLRRGIHAESDTYHTGLDVMLNHPLDRTFRLRLMDPPTWPSGVRDPQIAIVLDLGAEGTIPFDRDLIYAGDDTWLAPHQLSALTGNLAEARYTLYTTLEANGAQDLPRAYNLVQGVANVVEDRTPVVDEDGDWRLELAWIDADLYGLWGTSANQIYAVGERGRILLNAGNGWTQQSSGTKATLRAIAGRAADEIFVVGEDDTVLQFDGAGWEQLPGVPEDDFRAAATAPGQPLYVAGEVDTYRYEEGAWLVEAHPALKELKALAVSQSGVVAAVGMFGRLFVKVPGGEWTAIATPTQQHLRGVWLSDDGQEIVAVGHGGTVLAGAATGPVQLVPLSTTYDLFAVHGGPDGTVRIVGDYGQAVTRRPDGLWHESTIPDYRSRAMAVFAPPDGGPARAVGQAAFILGPFLHFPYMVAPQLLEPLPVDRRLRWTWDGGPVGSYTEVGIADLTFYPLWTLIVDAEQQWAELPDFSGTGANPLGFGTRIVSLTRVLNEDFDIDNYSSDEFSIYRRSSWTINESSFNAQ